MQTLQTPISLIGGTKLACRLWWRHEWWGKVLCPLAILGMWLVSLSFYAILTILLPLWIVWGMYTISRRHHIRADRRARGLPGDPGELTADERAYVQGQITMGELDRREGGSPL